MVWDNILNEIKKLKNTENPAESNPNPPEEPKPLQEEVPQKQWYQIGDWFTRTDELLEAILLQLQTMAAVTPALPPPPEPEEPVFPSGIEPLLNVIAREQTLTKELLEGYNFVTNQAVVAAPGTRVEVISTVKTYLVVIRSNVVNTGNIYVGTTGVSAATGFILGAGEAIAIPIDNLKKSIYLDADVAGEGVSWLALVD